MNDLVVAFGQAIVIVIGIFGLWTLVCWIILTILSKLDRLTCATAFFFCGLAFIVGALTLLIWIGS